MWHYYKGLFAVALITLFVFTIVFAASAQNNASLSVDCNSSTLTLNAYLTTSNNNRINVLIFKDNNIVSTASDITGPSFSHTFSLSGSGTYYAKVREVNNDGNEVNSSNLSINCSTNPPPPPPPGTNSATLSANCGASQLTISGNLTTSNGNRINILIYKDNGIVGSVSDIPGPSYSTVVPLNGSGSYYALVREVNNDANSATSAVLEVNCSTNPPPPPPSGPDITIPVPHLPNLPLASSSFNGDLNEVNCNHIRGWAINLNTPTQSTTIDIYINGQLAASNVLANLPRQDVANNYSITGFNAFGYDIQLPNKYQVGSTLVVLVKFAGTSTNVSNCPQTTQACFNNSGFSTNTICGVERIFPGSGQSFSNKVTRTGKPSIQLSLQDFKSIPSLTSKFIQVRKGDKLSFSTYMFSANESKHNLLPQFAAGIGGTLTGIAISPNQTTSTDQRRSNSSTSIVGVSVSFSLPLIRSLAKFTPKASVELAFYNQQGRFVYRQIVKVSKKNTGGWQKLNIEGHAPENGYVLLRLQNRSKLPVWFDDIEFQATQNKRIVIDSEEISSSKTLYSTNGFNSQMNIDKLSVYSTSECSDDGIWLDIDVTVKAQRYPVIVGVISDPIASHSDNPNPPQGSSNPVGGGDGSDHSSLLGISVKKVGRDQINPQTDYRLYTKTCEALTYMFDQALHTSSEVCALITSQGLIMLPNEFAMVDASGRRTFCIKCAPIKRDPTGWYLDTDSGKAYISGEIHTHPNKIGDPGFYPVGEPSPDDIATALDFGSSISQYIITPYHMNYYEIGNVNGENIMAFKTTVYNANTAVCPGTQQN